MGDSRGEIGSDVITHAAASTVPPEGWPMNSIDMLLEAVLGAFVRVVSENPKLRADLRAALVPDETVVVAEAAYLGIRDYAKRLGVSPRTIEYRIASGLPCERVGRCRRIPVQRADEWIRSRSAGAERDALAARARADADRYARKMIK